MNNDSTQQSGTEKSTEERLIKAQEK